MFDLKNKVALVTGAGRGIGLAYVKELLKNELKGVSLIDVNSTIGQEALNEVTAIFGKDRAIFIKADVSSRSEMDGAFEKTVKTFGQLDIVINNAGMANEFHWEKCVAVNLVGVITGSMLASDKYFPKYKSGPEAVIINMSSKAGIIPHEEMPVYTCTKYGVLGFSRALGGELRYKNSNVRVVTVCPGLTDTEMIHVTKEQMPEPYLSLRLSKKGETNGQSTETVAKYVMNLIKDAPTGSVWFLEKDKCEQLSFPDYCS